MKDEVNKIINLYNDHYRKNGMSQKSLGWGEKNRSRLRFEILTSAWNLNNQSILDVGCGFGDLFLFLQQKKIKYSDYLGIDLNKKFITNSCRLHPEGNFKQMNLYKDMSLGKFNYVFASGIFNDKLKNNLKYIKNTLEKINECATHGFAVNFLSDKVQYRIDHVYHSNPGKILEICYKYSNNIILRNDYMPFEFTVFINKTAKYDAHLAVYHQFLKYL